MSKYGQTKLEFTVISIILVSITFNILHNHKTPKILSITLNSSFRTQSLQNHLFLNQPGYQKSLIELFTEEAEVPISISGIRSTGKAIKAISLNFVDCAFIAISRETILKELELITPSLLNLQYTVSGYQSQKSQFTNESHKISYWVTPESYEKVILQGKSDFNDREKNSFSVINPDRVYSKIQSNRRKLIISNQWISKSLNRYHYDIVTQTKIKDDVRLIIVCNKIKNKQIQTLKNFFYEKKNFQKIKRLRERYFGYLNELSIEDKNAFIQRLSSRLPKLESIFREASSFYGMNWHLLAALGYQESQWNPEAVSPTGVKGLMMLTKPTAKSLGVTNRKSVRQNIFAATYYLRILRDNLPASVKEPDRTWMALAAYNVGNAHLEDARILAVRMGLNPNYWQSVKRTLPLLAKKIHYQSLKRGYARGGQAVKLVERVRNFHDMLAYLR